MAKNILRMVLDKHGNSQTDLARTSGISISTINKVCQEKLNPAPKTKGKILLALNSLTGTKYNHDEVFSLTGEEND
ncbi:MAG: helix-turn-helix domain-containing protein [Methylobacter sp.]